MRDFFTSRSRRLWILLSGFFISNTLIAEFMGVKLFSLEKTLGFPEANWTLLGQSNLNFTLTAGVLLWPMVFIMTDIINEYYGRKGVRLLSYLTAGLIAYGFLMVTLAMKLEPADFWRTAHINPDWSAEQKAAALAQVGDYNQAYNLIFGQSQWIIVGSLIAFLLGQIVDVNVFHRIKKSTGEDKIWMRATGSTLVSQLIDTGDSFVNEQIFNKSRFTDRIQASIFSHISGKKINIYNGLVFIFLITLVLIFLFKANRGIVGISGYNNDNNKIEIGK